MKRLARVVAIILVSILLHGMILGEETEIRVLDPDSEADAEHLWFLFGHWKREMFLSVVDTGLIRGYPDRILRPLETMTRYEFAAAWARALPTLGFEPYTPALAGVITDVPEGHWARESLAQLVSCGLLPLLRFRDVDPLHWAAHDVAALTDSSNSERQRYLVYSGNRPLRREEFVIMVHRTYRVGSELGLTPLSAREVAARAPLDFAIDQEIMIGYPDGEFHPDRPLTRMDFAWAATRLLDYWEWMRRQD